MIKKIFSGFAIDWCAFRLMVFDIQDSNYKELTSPKNDMNISITTTAKPIDNYYSQRLRALGHIPMLQRDEIPRRQISSEFLLSAIPAIVVFVIAALVLFGLLWFKRKDEPEEEWEAFTESLFLVVKVHTGTKV